MSRLTSWICVLICSCVLMSWKALQSGQCYKAVISEVSMGLQGISVTALSHTWHSNALAGLRRHAQHAKFHALFLLLLSIPYLQIAPL